MSVPLTQAQHVLSDAGRGVALAHASMSRIARQGMFVDSRIGGAHGHLGREIRWFLLVGPEIGLLGNGGKLWAGLVV